SPPTAFRHQHAKPAGKAWWGGRGSNPRPTDYEGDNRVRTACSRLHTYLSSPAILPGRGSVSMTAPMTASAQWTFLRPPPEDPTPCSCWTSASRLAATDPHHA